MKIQGSSICTSVCAFVNVMCCNWPVSNSLHIHHQGNMNSEYRPSPCVCIGHWVVTGIHLYSCFCSVDTGRYVYSVLLIQGGMFIVFC